MQCLTGLSGRSFGAQNVNDFFSCSPFMSYDVSKLMASFIIMLPFTVETISFIKTCRLISLFEMKERKILRFVAFFSLHFTILFFRELFCSCNGNLRVLLLALLSESENNTSVVCTSRNFHHGAAVRI